MNAAEIRAALGNERGGLCRCPLADEHTNGDADPSFSVKDKGDGGVLVHCLSRHANEQDRVIEALKARGLWPAGNAPNARAASKSQASASDEDYELISPVQPGAPNPDSTAKFFFIKNFGARDEDSFHRFDYRTAECDLLFHVYRFDPPGKPKEIRPLSLWRNRTSGNLRWRVKWPFKPLPLYGLERLAQYPELPILLLEGEKKTDAAAELLENSYVPVSLPGGAKAIGKVDLSPLLGRRVVVWPDHDSDGFDAMAKATRAIESGHAGSGLTGLRAATVGNLSAAMGPVFATCVDGARDLVDHDDAGAGRGAPTPAREQPHRRAGSTVSFDPLGINAIPRLRKSDSNATASIKNPLYP